MDRTRRLSTGISGLDHVLHGGLLPGRGYMVAGDPGTGKTILGIQFLLAGLEDDESCLFVNLEEDEADIRYNASTLGLDMDGVDFLDLTPTESAAPSDHEYNIFAPGEVEGPAITDSIRAQMTDLDPDRVFIDPLTQLRRFAVDDAAFRIQVLELVDSLTDRGATVLFTSQATQTTPDDDLQYVSDGTIELSMDGPDRSIRVPKFRGSPTRSGNHALRIAEGGLVVHPVLEPGKPATGFTNQQVSSGIDEVDALLHGGIERGTITLLSGPTGVGKTTLGTTFLEAAASRGERSVLYTFEETTETLITRCRAVGIPADEMVDAGTLSVQEVAALELSAAEFADAVKTEVEERETSIVMIDGIDGYRLSIRGPNADLERELNSLGRYLKNRGVTVILVDAVDAVTGDFQPTSKNVSYLADTIVFLRYLEVRGELRKAIGILKKRTGNFERTLREFEITGTGIAVGDPLTGLRGILRGTPEFIDDSPAEAADRDGR